MRVSSLGLRIFTTAMLAACALMLLFWQSLVGERPGSAAPLEVNKAYAIKFAMTMGVLVLFLVLSGVGAILILRRTAREYREQQMHNMRELVEATLSDHQRKEEHEAQ